MKKESKKEVCSCCGGAPHAKKGRGKHHHHKHAEHEQKPNPQTPNEKFPM